MKTVAALQEQLGSSPYALLAPRSNWARKDWPIERFSELCGWLIREHNLTCLVLGNLENASAYSAAFGSGRPRLLNLAGLLTFSESLELLPRAALTVGNDSALGHYAAVYQVPSLILFSAAHAVATWAPQSGPFICLQAQVPCRLCSFRTDVCDHDHLCMKSLTLEMAQSACNELLGLKEIARS